MFIRSLKVLQCRDTVCELIERDVEREGGEGERVSRESASVSEVLVEKLLYNYFYPSVGSGQVCTCAGSQSYGQYLVQ